jgi:hypothetical protein
MDDMDAIAQVEIVIHASVAEGGGPAHAVRGGRIVLSLSDG